MKKLFIYFCILSISISMLCSCSKEEIPAVPVQADETVRTRLARINIRDIGSITFKIYDSYEKEIANAFLEKASKGFYNNTEFFSIIEDYLMIAGNPASASETAYAFSGDYSRLFPFRGALCVSLNEDNKCTLDTFYIINNTTENLEDLEALIAYKGYQIKDYIKYGYDTELTEKETAYYKEYGGAPWLQGHTCVFGQISEGYETLEAIIEAHANNPEARFIIDNIETD